MLMVCKGRKNQKTHGNAEILSQERLQRKDNTMAVHSIIGEHSN